MTEQCELWVRRRRSAMPRCAGGWPVTHVYTATLLPWSSSSLRVPVLAQLCVDQWVWPAAVAKLSTSASELVYVCLTLTRSSIWCRSLAPWYMMKRRSWRILAGGLGDRFSNRDSDSCMQWIVESSQRQLQ